MERLKALGLIVLIVFCLLASTFFISCSPSQRDTLIKAAAPTQATVELHGQYLTVQQSVDTARAIIEAHLSEMSEEDQGALQAAYMSAMEAQRGFEQAMTGDDPAQIRQALKIGLDAYHQGIPVLVNNRTLFSPDEWAALVVANNGLAALAQEAMQLQDAAQLRDAAGKVATIIRLAVAVAF